MEWIEYDHSAFSSDLKINLGETEVESLADYYSEPQHTVQVKQAIYSLHNSKLWKLLAR